MKHLFITSLLFMFTAQSLHAQNINDTQMATPTCEVYVEWTGKNIEEIDLSILENRRYRILKPNSMMTMDYSPNRLNIDVTEYGIIISQHCG